MGQCWDCPRLGSFTCGPSRCCMDGPSQTYTLVAEERRSFNYARNLDSLLLPIPGRSASRGEVTHKKFADMNRKERRAFHSNKKR